VTPSGRGAAVFFSGLAMWLVARIIGSPGLEVVGLGLAALPAIAALFVRWGHQRIVIRRRLSDVRVTPGTRVTVHIEVENRSPASTSFLMLEDRSPPALGRSARLVVAGIPGHRSQQISYTVLPQSRGRYQLGPLLVDVYDPEGFLTADYTCRGTFNLSNYCNPILDALLAQARTKNAAEARYNIYRQVQSMLDDDAVSVFINHTVQIFAYNKKVQNYAPHLLEHYVLTPKLAIAK